MIKPKQKKKKNKETDYTRGLSAEHLNLAIQELAPVFTDIMNEILRFADVPQKLKTKTRQIIRYRATATLWRPHSK